jgi:hypothetical protein
VTPSELEVTPESLPGSSRVVLVRVSFSIGLPTVGEAGITGLDGMEDVDA